MYKNFVGYKGKFFFVIMDSFFEWWEVLFVKFIKSSNIIYMLWIWFVLVGILEELVSNYEFWFILVEFIDFLKYSGIGDIFVVFFYF